MLCLRRSVCSREFFLKDHRQHLWEQAIGVERTPEPLAAPAHLRAVVARIVATCRARAARQQRHRAALAPLVADVVVPQVEQRSIPRAQLSSGPISSARADARGAPPRFVQLQKRRVALITLSFGDVACSPMPAAAAAAGRARDHRGSRGWSSSRWLKFFAAPAPAAARGRRPRSRGRAAARRAAPTRAA